MATSLLRYPTFFTQEEAQVVPARLLPLHSRRFAKPAAEAMTVLSNPINYHSDIFTLMLTWHIDVAMTRLSG